MTFVQILVYVAKILIIPDTVFVQQIPEENDSEGDEFNIDTN